MKKSSSNRFKKALKAQIILLCVLCLFVATARAQSSDLFQVLAQASTLIHVNKLPEAEQELTPILRVAPHLPMALNLMGSLRAKQGRLLEAETLFLRAVRNDKNFVGARLNLAYLYLLKRAPEKAILQ